jgi:hypothetical protein
MIKPAPLHELIDKYDFVPQAIVDEAVSLLIKRMGGDIESGHDDFDEYQGGAAWLDDTPFAIMHYKGHPDGEATIYLPYGVSNLEGITKIIKRIADELELPPGSFKWQRKDDPLL